MTRVAFVTCEHIPEPDADQEYLLAACQQAGIPASMLAWDRPDSDPAAFDLCVIRSTWNYYENLDAFLRWIQRTATVTRLLNPAPVVSWNAHKGYLRDLGAAGIPVVETEWVERGATASIDALASRRGWEQLVIKPAVSAGSFATRKFRGPDAQAQAFLETLTARGDAMVQPYLDSVERGGEQSVLWIDGAVTHIIEKQPRFEGDHESVRLAPSMLPGAAEIVERTLEATPVKTEELLYARTDVILDAQGTPRVSELEVIEPSLFLREAPAALDRLVQGLQQRLSA